jgi:DNA-binding NarL/FixJ family response regulator
MVEYEAGQDGSLACEAGERHDGSMPAAEAIQVLMADDDALLRGLVGEALASFFDLHCLACVADGMAALAQAARAERLDVAVLDVSMPGPPIEELIPALRVRHPALSIVMLTGHADAAIVQRCHQAGANTYLLKGQPGWINALAQRIRALHIQRGGEPHPLDDWPD